MSEPLTLAAPADAVLAITTASGDVTVTGEPRSDIVFERGAKGRDQISIEEGGRVTLTPRSSAEVKVRCPEGTDVIVGSASGDVALRGRLGRCRVTTASGDITVEEVASIDVRTASGDVEIDRCEGRCRAHTASGDVTVGDAGQLDVGTVSSTVQADDVSGTVRVRTVSGKVDVCAGGDGDVSVRSMSGSVTVRLPPEVRPKLRVTSLSGSTRCDCERGEDCVVSVSSASGSVVVTPGG